MLHWLGTDFKQKYSPVDPPDQTGGGGVGDGAGDVHAGAALGEDVGGAVNPGYRDCNGNTTLGNHHRRVSAYLPAAFAILLPNFAPCFQGYTPFPLDFALF